MKTFHLLCMTEGLLAEGDAMKFMTDMFHHAWGEPVNIGDKDLLRTLLLKRGYDADTLFDMSDNMDIRTRVKANTDKAISRGMFGAPTFFIGDELYFGQDRLDFVEDALTDRLWV